MRMGHYQGSPLLLLGFLGLEGLLLLFALFPLLLLGLFALLALLLLIYVFVFSFPLLFFLILVDLILLHDLGPLLIFVIKGFQLLEGFKGHLSVVGLICEVVIVTV
jgi:hypothetical protein